MGLRKWKSSQHCVKANTIVSPAGANFVPFSTVVFRFVIFCLISIATTAQTKDATSASKKNYSSSADPNYHYPINVMNSCPHAATETKRYCVTIELSIETNRHAYYANLWSILTMVQIFLTIKSPDEWAITKQACRDKSIVSLFFSPSQHISRSTSTYRAL